jgi:hypothetical protein
MLGAFTNKTKVSYRLGNWRNGFLAAAKDSFTTLLSDNPTALSTPSEIASAVRWYLEGDIAEGAKEMTAPYQWLSWRGPKKKKVRALLKLSQYDLC